MIRINLLPVKAAKKREAGQRQLLLLVLGIFGVIGVILAVHLYKTAEVDRLRQRNRELSGRLAKLKAEIGDYDVIKAQFDELTRQKQTIDRLKSGRTGPVGVMRELSDIISKGRGPRLNVAEYEVLLKKDPNAGYNPTWDPRRLWLTKYSEVDRNVKMEGLARDGEDIAEFMRRLGVSDYFYDVKPLPATETVEKDTKINLKQFAVSAKVRY